MALLALTGLGAFCRGRLAREVMEYAYGEGDSGGRAAWRGLLSGLGTLCAWALLPHAFLLGLCCGAGRSGGGGGLTVALLVSCCALVCLCFVGTRVLERGLPTYRHTLLRRHPPQPLALAHVSPPAVNRGGDRGGGVPVRVSRWHPLRLRMAGLLVGFLAALVFSTVYTMQFVYAYYDYSCQGRLAVTLWLLPSAVVTGALLLPVSWDWVASEGVGSGGDPLHGEGKEQSLAWSVVLLWLPPLPLLPASATAGPAGRPWTRSLYHPAAALLSCCLLFGAFLYFTVVFAECLQLAAVALSSSSSSSLGKWEAEGEGRAALAAVPFAEQYPHSLLLHPYIVFSILSGVAEAQKLRAISTSRGFTAATLALGGSGGEGPFTPFSASTPLLRFAYLHSQVTLPLTFLSLLSSAVGWWVLLGQRSQSFRRSLRNSKD